jgi:hypothetical protein
VAGAGTVSRSLEAERVDGDWRIVTPLVEGLGIFFDPSAPQSIAGVPIVSEGTMLYPGRYTFDTVTGPVLQVGGTEFTVDGDPRTPVEAYSTSALVPEVAALATQYAMLVAVTCDSSETCLVAPGTALEPTGEPYMSFSTPTEVEVWVPLSTGGHLGARWLEVPLRILLDEEGAAVAWECGTAGDFSGLFEPCPALG